jgi:hypothetical protein
LAGIHTARAVLALRLLRMAARRRLSARSAAVTGRCQRDLRRRLVEDAGLKIGTGIPGECHHGVASGENRVKDHSDCSIALCRSEARPEVSDSTR